MSDTSPIRHARFSARFAVALAQFTSREPTRYYLNGIQVEPHPIAGVLLVATDGHKMAVIHDEAGYSNGSWICRFPPRLLRASATVIRAKNRAWQTAADVHFVGDSAYVTDEEFRPADADPTTIGRHHIFAGFAPAIDGIFPNWRAVVPAASAVAGTMLPLYPKHLKAFTEVSRAITRIESSLIIFPAAPTNVAVIRIPEFPGFLGLIMPMRPCDDFGGELSKAIPDFARTPDITDSKPQAAE